MIERPVDNRVGVLLLTAGEVNCRDVALRQKKNCFFSTAASL